MSNHNQTRTARRAEGLGTYQAEEERLQAKRAGMDEIVREHWETESPWDIVAIIWKRLKIDVTAKDVWSSHQRTSREQTTIDRNRADAQKD